MFTVNTNPTAIPGTASSSGPRTIIFNNNFYVFYRNQSDQALYTSFAPLSLSGGTWSTPAQITGGAFTSDTPSPCIFNNQLFVFYKGVTGDSRIWQVTSRDGTTWTSPQTVLLFRGTSAAPCAVAPPQSGSMYMFYRGPDNNSLYGSISQDGSTWSIDVAGPANTQTDIAPNAIANSAQVTVLFGCVGGTTNISIATRFPGLLSTGWAVTAASSVGTNVVPKPFGINIGANLGVLYKGIAGDDNLYMARDAASGWTTCALLDSYNTDAGPELSNQFGLLFYKGAGSGAAIYYAALPAMPPCYP
jgi:hypothetical protein